MKKLNTTFIHFLFTAIAVFGLYWQTTGFGFVLDDKMVITDNTFVKEGMDGLPDIFGNDTMTGFLGKQPDLLAGGRYRPLSLAVFAVIYNFFELNTFYYHLLNILFYFLCCILVYLTLKLLFPAQENEKQKIKLYIFAATLLFAIHPIHTEAVANIKGMDEILAFLFGALTFIFSLLYFDKKKIAYLVTAFVTMLLSLLAKESTLPLLFAVPVSLYFFRNSSLKAVLRYFLFLLIPIAVYLIIRQQALGFLINNEVHVTGIMNAPYFDATLSQKAGTIAFTLLLYIKLLFFPHPLTHDYYPYQIQLHEIYQPVSIVSFLIIGFLIWIAIKGIKSRNQLAYIIFYFFITISIVSNVVINVGTFMNERFLFVPSFALPMLVAFTAEKFDRNRKIRRIIWGLLAVFLIGFVYKSADRIPDWESNKTLNAAAIKVSKNSARANCFYAVSLYDDILAEQNTEIKKDQIEEAQKYIERSLQIYPEYADALRMKAGLAAEEYKMDHDVDKLLGVFLNILKVRHVAYIDEFTDWLQRRTDKEKMADFYFQAGYSIFAAEKHKLNYASQYLQKGYKLDPENRKILFGSCVVSYLTEDYPKTIAYGTKYLNTFGENAEILYYVGNAHLKLGKPQQGNRNIEQAYRLKPELKTKN